MNRISIKAKIEPNGFPMTVVGRNAWALLQLIAAGDKGVTPFSHPGPRWSSYVHKLRSRHGIAIETKEEDHDGPFAGTHARYRLASEVTIIEGAADERPAG